MIPDSPNNGIKDSNDIVAAFMAYLAMKANSSSNPEAYRILSNIEAKEWGGYTQMAYAYLNAESTREEVAKVFEQFGIVLCDSCCAMPKEFGYHFQSYPPVQASGCIGVSGYMGEYRLVNTT